MRGQREPVVLVTWDRAVAAELRTLAQAGQEKAIAEARREGYGPVAAKSKTRLLQDDGVRSLVGHVCDLELHAPDGLDETGQVGEFSGPRNLLNNPQAHLVDVCNGLGDYHGWLDQHQVPFLCGDGKPEMD